MGREFTTSPTTAIRTEDAAIEEREGPCLELKLKIKEEMVGA